MDAINSNFVNAVYSAAVQQPQQLESMANSALGHGIDLLMEKDYEGAIKEFKRSLGLSPYSTFSSKASEYMANAYLALNQTEKAIDTYKTAIKVDPTRDDFHIKLGNLYFSEERYEEAERVYKEAVEINPSANNRYFLGQVYLFTGRYNEAEIQFTKVKRLTPDQPTGNYGLGLTYSKMGRYEDAIEQFKDAVALRRDFYDAHAEIGYAYADLGQMDKAQEIVDFLEEKEPDLADIVSRYMYKVDPPKFTMAWGSGTFPYRRSINTLVSSLDDDLAEANASKVFTMKLQFDKEMDRATVENVINWRIGRAIGGGAGETYNFGIPIPSTEIRLTPVPESVYYDSELWRAVIKFRIQQNDSADGTLDPSHIEFKFSGMDSHGYAMDPEADQYSGFTGIA